MAKTVFNIYLIGVGGQGIGLLSELIIRAADYAGCEVIGVDTHGLAQRGGTVESHIRIGNKDLSPLVQKNAAHLALALEKTEAYRALSTYSAPNSTLVFYDTEWQSLSVRLQTEKPLTEKDFDKLSQVKNVNVHTVYNADLPDTKMQNVALLSEINRLKLIPDIRTEDYLTAMQDLLAEPLLEKNLAVFKK